MESLLASFTLPMAIAVVGSVVTITVGIVTLIIKSKQDEKADGVGKDLDKVRDRLTAIESRYPDQIKDIKEDIDKLESKIDGFVKEMMEILREDR